jgi:tetratricopeptide (TPR) repeat protein
MTTRRAVELFRQLVYDRGRHEVLYPLAESCSNLATILRAQGRPQDALELSRWSVQATEQLVADQGRDDLVVGLAMANLVLGRSLVSLQRLAEGCDALWRAAEVIRAGVYLMGRVDQWASLASIHIEAAQASWHAGDRARATEGFRVALRAVERRPDGALLCAKAHTGCARVLWELAEHPSARDHAARAVDLWSRLVRSGLPQHSPDLAYAQGMYAVLAMACGDMTGAAQFARQAIPALRAEATRTGRADLRQLLDVLATHFGRIA